MIREHKRRHTHMGCTPCNTLEVEYKIMPGRYDVIRDFLNHERGGGVAIKGKHVCRSVLPGVCTGLS